MLPAPGLNDDASLGVPDTVPEGSLGWVHPSQQRVRAHIPQQRDLQGSVRKTALSGRNEKLVRLERDKEDRGDSLQSI